MPSVSIFFSDEAYQALRRMEQGKKRKASEIASKAVLDFAKTFTDIQCNECRAYLVKTPTAVKDKIYWDLICANPACKEYNTIHPNSRSQRAEEVDPF